MSLIFIALPIVLMVLMTLFARRDDRAILGILTTSTFYYAVCGLYYWGYVKDGIFVGYQWPLDSLIRSAILLCTSSCALAFFITVAGFVMPTVAQPIYEISKSRTRTPGFLSEPIFAALLSLGLAASLFVLAKGSFSSSSDPTSRGPLFLIAYQFSDILIAIICYDVARRGFRRENFILAAYFLFYSVLVGFRYKIALMVIPVSLCMLFSNVSNTKKFTVSGVSAICVFTMFSLMTLFRVKFGAPDFTRNISNPAEELVYGLFAEANVLFGFTSVVRVHVDQGVTVLFQPLVDAFRELMPRFLFPDRTSGEYMKSMMLGMLSVEGRRSATAYPWIGEFCIMFGKAGFFIGPPVLAAVYVGLKAAVLHSTMSKTKALMGIFLLAGLIGYFHFGRGYTPALVKAYIFIAAPYILMCLSQRSADASQRDLVLARR